MILALFSLYASSVAQAQDDDSLGNVGDLMKEIDLGMGGSKTAADELSFNGTNSQNAPNYKPGTPVKITHAGGKVVVRCQEQEGLSTRLSYTLWGTDGPALEAMGNAIGLSAWGDASGGGAATRVPGASSGVSRTDIVLTVNLPKEASVSVSGGRGTVQVIDCKGKVSITNSEGGSYVSGTISNLNVNTKAGDVKVELNVDSTLTGSNSVIAGGGNVSMILPMTYAGKIAATGANVNVFHTVDGIHDPTKVQGTIGTGTASLTMSAKGDIEVKAH